MVEPCGRLVAIIRPPFPTVGPEQIRDSAISGGLYPSEISKSTRHGQHNKRYFPPPSQANTQRQIEDLRSDMAKMRDSIATMLDGGTDRISGWYDDASEPATRVGSKLKARRVSFSEVFICPRVQCLGGQYL